MKNNPKKLSDFDRRKQLYFEKWGLNEKNSTGDLRSDMGVWIDQADKEKAEPKGRDFYYNPSTNEMELVSNPSPLRPTKPKADQEKKNKSVKAIPKKIDVDSITKSRIFLKKMRGDFDYD